MVSLGVQPERFMSNHAELIIVNGRLKTVNPARPTAEALAVADGHIVAIGERAAIEDLRGPGTRVIDAAGGSVVPGFIEGHMHLFPGAAELAHLQLHGVRGSLSLEAAIRNYANARPGAPMLLGQGVDYAVLGNRAVNRHDLDRALPDRPFAMAAPDHHTVWANTMALEIAGILHGKPLGPGNEIVMGDDGLATGELRETEAFQPVLKLAGEARSHLGLSTGGEPDPAPSLKQQEADRTTMQRGLDWCARHGITSIHNMDGNLYQLELLSQIEDAGGLHCRTKIPFHFKNFMAIDMLEKASLMAERYHSEWLSSGLVKLFYDGVIESWTGVLIEPYADRPDWRGEPLFTPERFAEIAAEIDRRGLQIAVHSIGDGAVRAVLDGYERASKVNGRRDSRHRVEHIELIAPADIPRFAELGVLASMQPTHAPAARGVPLEPTISRIGRDRWPNTFAVRALVNAAAKLVFASDWPVAPIDPIVGIQAAMLRKPWADGLPDQSLTLDEALAAYTTGGAYAEFMEHRKGMLKEGYLADIVVLSGDLDACFPEMLTEIRAITTICGGRITYRD
jgi:predicted amidohydrolase YtcJ